MTEPLDSRFYDLKAHDYDAVLIVSFGGPEGPDDVMPFLDNVFRGLRVTEETKQRIAARYQDFGGISPDSFERSIYDVLVDPDTAAADAIQPTPLDELDLLPATISVANLQAAREESRI